MDRLEEIEEAWRKCLEYNMYMPDDYINWLISKVKSLQEENKRLLEGMREILVGNYSFSEIDMMIYKLLEKKG